MLPTIVPGESRFALAGRFCAGVPARQAARMAATPRPAAHAAQLPAAA
jgi:hypothetical protein